MKKHVIWGDGFYADWLTRKCVQTGIAVARIAGEGDFVQALDSKIPESISLFLSPYEMLKAIPLLKAIGVAGEGGAHIFVFSRFVKIEESLLELCGAENVAGVLLLDRLDSITMNKKKYRFAASGENTAIIKFENAFKPFAKVAQHVTDFSAFRWSHFLCDLIGKATALIFQRPFPDILEDFELLELEADILLEAAAILEAAGVRLVNLPTYDCLILMKQISINSYRRRKRALLAYQRLDDLASPKLRLITVNGNPITEIAWLHGIVASLAEDNRLLAPINHAVSLFISDMVSGKSRMSGGSYHDIKEALLASVRIASKRPKWDRIHKTIHNNQAE